MKTILASSLYGSAFEPQLVQGLQSGRITKLLVPMEPQPEQTGREGTKGWSWFAGHHFVSWPFAEVPPLILHHYCPYQPGDVLEIEETTFRDHCGSLRFSTDTTVVLYDDAANIRMRDGELYGIRHRPVVQAIGVVQVSEMSLEIAVHCGVELFGSVYISVLSRDPEKPETVSNFQQAWQSQHPSKDWAWVIDVSNRKGE